MKTKYKFIYFEKYEDTGKTSKWECRNNSSHDCLGLVQWYGPWRQYCFCSQGGCVFSSGCLADIQDFIRQLDSARKDANAKEAAQ